MHESPKIDRRSAGDIFNEAARYLKKDLDIRADRIDPPAEALLRVFARYCELIIQRLNKVPDKNHAAFLDLLNLSRIPPVSARVPLTFTPVRVLPGEPGSVRVPARTQVAAAPGAGETEPTLFETTRDVTLTNLALKKVLVLDPETDLYADKTYLAVPEQGGASEFAFEGRQPVVHELYLGHGAIFGGPAISTLRLQFEIDQSRSANTGGQDVDWWIPADGAKIPLTPVRDDTAGLTRSGEVVFRDLPQWPRYRLADHQTNWLGCRLQSRLRLRQPAGGALAPKVPMIGKVMISAVWEVREGMLEDARFNAIPIDFSKDFYPFGERPRFGDVFYLKCEAFSKPLARTVLHITLTNPASAGKDAPFPAVNDRGDPVVRWEYWNGRRWTELVCRGSTTALIENGSIAFTVPASVSPATVNGIEGFWVRARLVSGNYGEDERFEYGGPDQAPRRIPATLAPPSIQSITVTTALAAGPEQPEQIVTNNFFFKQYRAGGYFQPFQLATEQYKALYLGFNFPNGSQKDLAELSVDLYFYMHGTVGRAFVCESSMRPIPELVWQVWNGNNWVAADIADETESLSRSGLISIRTRDSIAPCKAISLAPEPCYWVRVLWVSGAYECAPKLCRILLNTVSASQTVTIENELLGSSNGLPNQIFRSALVPILQNLQIEVREPDLPSTDEYPVSIRQPGEQEGVEVKRDRRGNVEQIWVRWREVTDFLSSTHKDRHFIVERQSGEIRFGDGIQGLIPPAGANNIRLRKYQTGGGLFGNKPAGSVNQLRTGISYVSSVTNLEPAFGGQNIEDWDALRERGASLLRHRRRAVTRQDYEDLAKLASPVVAKAKCYPNLNLVQDPAGEKELPGVVSLIVVANSPGRRPQTDLHVLQQVAKYINARRAADTELIVLAPEYVCVVIETLIVAKGTDSGAAAMALGKQAISRYLHPLTGGDHGRGWPFGRLPHESDLYAVLEAIPEVEYVHSLVIHWKEEREGLLQSPQFLIYGAEPEIQLKF